MQNNQLRPQRVVIVTGGEIETGDLQQIHSTDWVIGVDGGVVALLNQGIIPQMAVGDFDTAGAGIYSELLQRKVRVKKLPRAKGLTDTHYAVEQALALKPKTIVLLGALGGSRFDHALGNLFLLEKMKLAGVMGVIWSQKSVVRLLVGPEEVNINASSYSYLSLLPITEQVSGVTLTGFLYPLHQATLRRGDTLGISNEITGPRGKIAVKKGKLLVIESKD